MGKEHLVRTAEMIAAGLVALSAAHLPFFTSRSSVEAQSQQPIVFLARTENVELYGLCRGGPPQHIRTFEDPNWLRINDFTRSGEAGGATDFGPYYLITKVNRDRTYNTVHLTRGENYGWTVGMEGVVDTSGRYQVSAYTFALEPDWFPQGFPEAKNRDVIERVEAVLECPQVPSFGVATQDSRTITVP